MDGTATLISTVLTDHYQLDTTKTASASYTPLRARLLRNAQRKARKLWNLRDWTFRYANGIPVTILANTNEIALPADWANEGREGLVTLPDGTPLEWHRASEVRLCQQQNDSDRGTPFMYSVDGLRKLIVEVKVQADTIITLHYQMATPTLTDATPGGLTLFPAEWHDLLYELVVFEEMKKDPDALPAQAELVRGMIEDMVCNEEQGQAELKEIPRYPGSADVFFADDWIG